MLDLNDLYAIEDLAEKHPRVLSVGTLRHQLNQRHTNGLAGACVKVGKRLLISESGYRQWLAQQGTAGVSQ